MTDRPTEWVMPRHLRCSACSRYPHDIGCPEWRTMSHKDRLLEASLAERAAPEPAPATDRKVPDWRLNELIEWAFMGLDPTAPQGDLLPLLAELREIRKQPPEPGEQYESGWVIEGAWSSAHLPDYWVGSSAWSTNPYKALRFANQQSAQQAADLMCSGMNVRICEHEWAASPETKEGGL